MCHTVGELKQPSGVFIVSSQAAKYYELASKWGHATAMYNLGVFYVHGWGGVPVDCNLARELFVAAAELGQPNAQEALAMVPPASGKDSTGNSICLLSSQDREDLPCKLMYGVL
jgi:TPR repeat protein